MPLVLDFPYSWSMVVSVIIDIGLDPQIGNAVIVSLGAPMATKTLVAAETTNTG
jgi:hypothetical protein